MIIKIFVEHSVENIIVSSIIKNESGAFYQFKNYKTTYKLRVPEIHIPFTTLILI